MSALLFALIRRVSNWNSNEYINAHAVLWCVVGDHVFSVVCAVLWCMVGDHVYSVVWVIIYAQCFGVRYALRTNINNFYSILFSFILNWNLKKQIYLEWLKCNSPNLYYNTGLYGRCIRTHSWTLLNILIISRGAGVSVADIFIASKNGSTHDLLV